MINCSMFQVKYFIMGIKVSVSEWYDLHLDNLEKKSGDIGKLKKAYQGAVDYLHFFLH
jgi:hypothetical protein